MKDTALDAALAHVATASRASWKPARRFTGEHAIPGLVGHRGDGVGLEAPRARAVNEDRERAERFQRPREQRGRPVSRRQVGGHEACVTARRANRRGDLFSARRLHVREHDAPAFAREGGGNPAPDARCTAGNQCGFALEQALCHRGPPFVQCGFFASAAIRRAPTSTLSSIGTDTRSAMRAASPASPAPPRITAFASSRSAAARHPPPGSRAPIRIGGDLATGERDRAHAREPVSVTKLRREPFEHRLPRRAAGHDREAPGRLRRLDHRCLAQAEHRHRTRLLQREQARVAEAREQHCVAPGTVGL
jgi:hypothetical protein